MKFKSSTILLFVLAGLLLAFYFVVNCLHFQRSDYTSDIFSLYQLSHDWLLGKPLFYENSFGFHSKLHNYFITLFIAPFTYIFGVYGIFVVLFSLALGALYAVLKMMDAMGTSIHAKWLFAILYISPLTYFIFHDENYGFHIELLLIPLGLLFISAFLQHKKWYLVWALLILLVKEDAVVFLCCLWITKYSSDWIKKDLTAKAFLIQSIAAGAICLLVFSAGLLWLKYMNHWSATRSGDVYSTLKEQPFNEILASFTYLLQTRIQLTCFVLVIVYFYAGWRFTVGAILLSTPILILNFLSGIFYMVDGAIFIKNTFSLLWAPRLGSYWAYWLGVLVIALTHKPSWYFYPYFIRTLACLVFGFLVFRLQYFFLKSCEVTRLDITKNMTEAFEPNIEFEYNTEFKDAASIAQQLPNHYPVAPMYRVFGAFYQQDIVWLNSWWNAYYPPRMILASYNKDEIPDVTKVMKHPVYMLYKEKLHIYTEVDDTIFIARAGIRGEWKELEMKP